MAHTKQHSTLIVRHNINRNSNCLTLKRINKIHISTHFYSNTTPPACVEFVWVRYWNCFSTRAVALIRAYPANTHMHSVYCWNDSENRIYSDSPTQRNSPYCRENFTKEIESFKMLNTMCVKIRYVQRVMYYYYN